MSLACGYGLNEVARPPKVVFLALPVKFADRESRFFRFSSFAPIRKPSINTEVVDTESQFQQAPHLLFSYREGRQHDCSRHRRSPPAVERAQG